MNLIKYTYHDSPGSREGEINLGSEVSEENFIQNDSQEMYSSESPSKETYSNSNIINVDSVHLYEKEPQVAKEIEIEKGRNYKDALQTLYEKTSTSLTRNNIDSVNKNSKTKTDSSIFTLQGKLEKESIEDFKGNNDQNWIEIVNKLKAENMKLRQENIKLQVYSPEVLISVLLPDLGLVPQVVNKRLNKAIPLQSIKSRKIDKNPQKKAEIYVKNKIENYDQKNRNTFGSGKNANMKNRMNSLQKVSSNYHRNKSRQVNQSMRYTNSLPEI